MDLGGLDMASSKVEKSAKITAMVGSMASKGKAVPKEMVKSVLKAPIPKAVKGAILSATMQGKTVQSIPRMAQPSVKPMVQGKAIVTSTPKVIAPVKGIVSSLGKGIIPSKAIVPARAIIPARAITPARTTRPTIMASAKANPINKKFDGDYGYDDFDTDDMFANVGGNVTNCGSGGSCPQGTYCLTNATNIQTGQVGNYCVPPNFTTSTPIRRYTSARFDGDEMMDNFSGGSDF